MGVSKKLETAMGMGPRDGLFVMRRAGVDMRRFIDTDTYSADSIYSRTLALSSRLPWSCNLPKWLYGKPARRYTAC